MQRPWPVADLQRPPTEMASNPPTDDNLRGLVSQLRDYWIDTDIGSAEMHDWALERFPVSGADYDPTALEKQLQLQVIPIMRLWKQCKRNGLIDVDREVTDELGAIFYAIRFVHNFLKSAAQLFNSMDSAKRYHIVEEAQIEHMFQKDEEQDTNFQCVLRHVLDEADRLEYRRCNEFCFKQIYTTEGHPTHAWQEAIAIDKFVYHCVPKETRMELWRKLTNPRDNASAVAKHLVVASEAEFIDIKVNRFLISFLNGIYNTEHDTFWAYDDEMLWEEKATVLTVYRRANGWSAQYEAKAPQRDDVTIRYLDQPFRFEISPETEETFNPLDIPTPEMDQMLKTQHLDEETAMWVFILLGRLFFPVNYFDKWQIVLFLKGVAGSGKSTIAKLIKYFYPKHLLGTLSSNIEQKFGLSAIYESLLAVCAEVREDFGLDQGDWQSAATGEEVSVAIKNQTAKSIVWDVPMLFAGNEYPKNYTNNSGSVDRRMLCVEFNYKVDIERSDPHLEHNLLQNADLFLRKAIRLYHEAVHKHGGHQIWASGVLPPQFHQFRMNMKLTVDPLMAFVNSGKFEFHVEYYMTLEQFRESYLEWRKKNGLGIVKFTKDHYMSTFADVKVLMSNVPREVGGERVRTTFLEGIREAETNY